MLTLIDAPRPPSAASRQRRRRANRVLERHAALIAAVAGIIAAFSPASPTGSTVIDAVLVGGSVAAVVFAAASAPWWSLVVATVLTMVVAVDPPLVALASAAGGLALFIGWRRRDLPELRAVAAAVLCIAGANAGLEEPFGLSAAVAIGAGGLLLTTGIRRRPRRIRRMARRLALGLAALGALATVGFLAEAAAARSSLVDGKHAVLLALDAVERGKYAEAAAQFARASDLLGTAGSHFDRPWASLASAVPVVAQHRHVASELSRHAASAANTAAQAAGLIDPETMRVENGVVDLAAVETIGDPIAALDTALRGMADSADDVDSPWLQPVARDELTELSDQLVDNVARLSNVKAAVELVPGMLGRDEPQLYLVLFTTPAEARGLGGFVGNYAELTIDAGQIEMTEFGRASDLELLAQQIGVRIDGHPSFLSRYGTFGYNTDGDGLVGTASWRNLTMSPDFPSVASIAADMYGQLTGRIVDGVITVDPYVLSTLLGYSGPVDLATVEVTLDSTNAANYILVDQYLVADHLDRIDALEEAARLTIERLLSGAMPAPTTLARELGPMAATGRLAIWSSDTAEADMLQRLGLLGEIPALEGSDGWSVTVTNAGGSKIDSFLNREFNYRADTGGDGVTAATLTATLANNAPASGLPDYVIGNELGMARGTSRLYVSFYSALHLQSVLLDGERTELAASQEAGWYVYSGFVQIPAGGSVTYRLTLAGEVANPDGVITWTQPLAIPPTTT